MRDDLLDCPICGAIPLLKYDGYSWSVTCLNCGMGVSECDAEQESVKLWNDIARKALRKTNRFSFRLMLMIILTLILAVASYLITDGWTT